MTIIEKDEHKKIVREGGKILKKILIEVSDFAREGVSTLALNNLAEKLILQANATPAFLNYEGFPAVLCTSINEEIVHCIPREDRILKSGDVLSLDLGILYQGFYLDSATTIAIGKVSDRIIDLIDTTRKSLSSALKEVKAGKNIGIVGCTVAKFAQTRGFAVVRDLVGHGVGRKLHEDPQIPNYGSCGFGPEIVKGQLLAIEPMLTNGGHKITKAVDGYGFATLDGSLAAHFEHTVLVGENGVEILT